MFLHSIHRGLNFRKAYADVAPAAQCLVGNNVPTLVLSATMTQSIMTELGNLLALDEPTIVAVLPNR